ncbi:MAG: restriction endonuclease subunit S [Archaeoglobus sp.]|uniref:restriction endonuclease subunit S n=1 Tax=Archaeoglobus sp. TaxID=1872626 RepID=UPI001E130B63|nr:restriction endonuclease subunit S [Archaeoglobus sp.]MBO8180638.1 restriction endonuclease subunit S [Archaeoglobus sp.]
MSHKETPIGRIPEDWEVVRLTDYVNILKGFAFSSKFFNEHYEGLPIIRIRDLGKNATEAYYSGPYDPAYIVEKGELLISMDGEFDIYLWNGPRGLLNQRVCKIWSKDVSKLDNIFLYYALKKPLKLIEVQTSQTTVKHLLDKDFQRIKIPLPPLPEQRKIAEILSTVDKAIEKVDEAIVKTERLKKGLMQELLTKGIGHTEFKDTEIGRIPKEWEVVRLGDICEAVGGGTPSKKRLEFWNGTIPWISPKDMQTEEIYDSQDHITEEAVKESSTRLIQPNSVLVVFRSGILAKKVPIAVNRVPVAINQDLKALTPKSNMEPNFLAYCLKAFEPAILKCVKRGSTVHSIIPERFFNLKIPLPPLEEQQKIAEILSTVDKKLELERKRKENLERIKKGLMNDLLTGRRRVKI